MRESIDFDFLVQLETRLCFRLPLLRSFPFLFKDLLNIAWPQGLVCLLVGCQYLLGGSYV